MIIVLQLKWKILENRYILSTIISMKWLLLMTSLVMSVIQYKRCSQIHTQQCFINYNNNITWNVTFTDDELKNIRSANKWEFEGDWKTWLNAYLSNVKYSRQQAYLLHLMNVISLKSITSRLRKMVLFRYILVILP